VTVTVAMFDDAVWSRLFDAMAAELGHLAALLDGELPTGIGAEQELPPGPGELETDCSCPDLVDPCKHAAAVCYVTADVLDADPFALLLLRGRTKVEVLGALRDRRRPTWSAPEASSPRTPTGECSLRHPHLQLRHPNPAAPSRSPPRRPPPASPPSNSPTWRQLPPSGPGTCCTESASRIVQGLSCTEPTAA
jgi:uncharacterized Zn finger protein